MVIARILGLTAYGAAHIFLLSGTPTQGMTMATYYVKEIVSAFSTPTLQDGFPRRCAIYAIFYFGWKMPR
jgi:hypothetical protein